MAYLAANASLDEIESELSFYAAVIASLDPLDEDYESTKAQHERTVAQLEEMWQAKQPDDQPEDASGNESNTNSVLELETFSQGDSAVALPSIGGSPLSIRAKQSILAPSTSSKKRPHQEIDGLWDQASQKSSYLAARDTPIFSSRASSVDSSHRASTNLPKTGYKNRLLERQMDAERRAKDRRERERLDADMARSLQAQDGHGLISSQATAQSYIDRNGGLRTVAPPPPSPGLMPSFSSTSEQSSMNEMPASGGSVKQEALNPWPVQPIPRSPGSVLDEGLESPHYSESSLEEITANDFYRQNVLSNNFLPQPSETFPANDFSQVALQDVQAWTDSLPPVQGRPSGYTTPFSANNPNTWPSQYHIPPRPTVSGLSSAGRATTSYQHPWLPSVVNGVINGAGGNYMDAIQRLVGATSSAFENWSVGDTLFSGMSGTHASPQAASYLTSGRSDLNYLYNDPTRNKEEIDNLLANIRPDEDLPDEMLGDSPRELTVPLMKHQKKALAWLTQQEEGTNKGAILADDMGLGKTVQALALMVTRRSEDPSRKTNLVVAPVALLRQWKKEIETKVKSSARLKTHIYHGTQKRKSSWASLRAFDVVITTYGALASEHRKITDWKLKHKGQVLDQSIAETLGVVLLAEKSRWYRVILDEAQCIKNPMAKTSIAAAHLSSMYRLCMTGTPMMNNVGELFPLIRFLRIPPFNDPQKFNSTFKRPLMTDRSDERSRKAAMRTLQALLKAVLLRRTKTSLIDGDPILVLPERITEKTHAVFSEDEMAFYKSLELSTSLQVNKYLKANTVGKNYSNILVLLLRLRQACCHPHLIKDHGITVDADISATQMEQLCKSLSPDVIRRIKEANGSFECPICYDAVENPAILYPCGHDMCSECFSRMTDSSTVIARGADGADAKCPECRGGVNRRNIIDYTIFEKVHLPDLWKQKHEDSTLDIDSDVDSESDSSDDGSQGDLDDFIVDDDEEIEYEEDVDEVVDTNPRIGENHLRGGKSRIPRHVIPSDEDDDEFLNIKGESDNERPRKLKLNVEDDSDYVWRNQSLKLNSGEETEGKQVDLVKFEDDDFKSTAKKSKRAKGKGKARKRPQKTLAELKKEGMRSQAAKRKYLRRLRRNWISSAKIDKTMEILKTIQTNDSSEKTIIFSQFTSLLDLLEVPIDMEGWNFRRYDGSMDANARHDSVETFCERQDCNIILVSLKAGNAGLNLNKASQVIILDPFWNPFIEEQAIDRAHRIGQTRKVYVHRVLIERTVEDRILALQDKKREIIEQALDEKAAQSVSRLGARELRYLFVSGPLRAPIMSRIKLMAVARTFNRTVELFNTITSVIFRSFELPDYVYLLSRSSADWVKVPEQETHLNGAFYKCTEHFGCGYTLQHYFRSRETRELFSVMASWSSHRNIGNRRGHMIPTEERVTSA